MPDGWSRCTLGDIVEIIRGVSYEKSDARDVPAPGLVPILRANNIGEKLGFKDLVYVPEARVSDEQRLQVGDIVVAASSGSRSVVGKAAPLLAPWRGAFGAFCMVVRPSPAVNPRYVAYFMSTREYRTRVSLLAAGVNINNLKRKHVSETPVPLAPRGEQDRIVSEIDKQFTRLDAGIAALERLRAHLRRYRAAVLASACQGRLVPPEAGLAVRRGSTFEPADRLLARLACAREAVKTASPYRRRRTLAAEQPLDPLPLTLPKGWAVARLSEIAEIRGGITKGQKRKADEKLSAVPYLRVANVQRGYLDLTEVRTIEASDEEIAELRLAPGDILFNEGGDRDKLGRGWVWSGQIPTCIHQNHVFRARLYGADMEPKFFSWYGNSFGQQYFLDQGKQTTNLASINMTKLSALPVPIPPANEQKRIVAEVEERLSAADAVEAGVLADLSRAARLRASVLRAAFDGRLVRPEQPARAPAA